MWWATVKDRRENDDPTSGSRRQDVPDGDDHRGTGMADNELARALRG